MTPDVDVLIIGAGISGIGAACHLARRRPQDTYAILEARDAIGGTWDLFRYPGVRSDSDMFTLGYGFRPWDGDKAIASGESIRDYIRATAREHGVDRRIRFGRRVTALDWDSRTATWTATAVRTDTGDEEVLTARFVHACTGYYRYDRGHTPDFDGLEDLAGRLVHPQAWPEDLDVDGKAVVVIGSGATAMTLVPALAAQGAHVTMLQRSPTYVASLPDTDPIADALRRHLPAGAAHAAIAWKNIAFSTLTYQLCRRAPGLMRRVLIGQVARQLPDRIDAAEHFTPAYDPWDQRLCLVPNNDLFKALRAGTADVVTDTVDRFVPEGVRTGSGAVLPADVVVTATGLELLMLGGVALAVDGEPVDVPERVAYKGMMLSDVPNLSFAIGYVNASWTLRVDLVAAYLCRLLDHMAATGADVVTPAAPDADEPRGPLIDLAAGYVRRAAHLMPRQGARAPWSVAQSYLADRRLFGVRDLEDEGIRFSRSADAGSSGQAVARTGAVA